MGFFLMFMMTSRQYHSKIYVVFGAASTLSAQKSEPFSFSGSAIAAGEAWDQEVGAALCGAVELDNDDLL